VAIAVSVTTMSTATASSRPTATAIATELGIIRVEPHPLLARSEFLARTEDVSLASED
jgi:hypothetical protein